MTEPVWLQKGVLFALHDRLLAEFGGGTGMRDMDRLDAALIRPRQCYLYGIMDMHTLAASFASAIIQGHPFIDGNKRTGFVCAVVFLELNGWICTATEQDAFVQTLALASSESSEEDYVNWLKLNSIKNAEA